MDVLSARGRGAPAPRGTSLTTRGRLPVALIAAVARNGVIGAGNALPWRLPADLRHFKALTVGKPVLMGRRTYESIGRPLPGRPVTVVSRDPGFDPPGVDVARSIPAAIAHADGIGRAMAAAELMVAGGGELYAALMSDADRIYLTHVEAVPSGDAFFPALDPSVWREHERSARVAPEGDAPAYWFATYARRNGGPSQAMPT